MPPKSSLRMRTWGTRFDTLPTSPPVSPPAREHVDTDVAQSNVPTTEPVLKRKDEKMPHDASVFVGSLPSNIDQQELTRLLSEHLSEHTEVKNIKVVRDSKGGVCAFVQCEDAASAASLINTLHSTTPKQFLGRTLRYEPARAFRTLLISYRIPMQHIPANSLEDDSKPQLVELNLPTAMRAWRPKNSKFYSLLYNNEAIDAENYARNDLAIASDKPSLFLQPVMLDAETIKTIATYFGPLENVNRFQLNKNITVDDVSEDWKLYPSPHDAPRSPKMDTGCWEIKWEHRDDCVSALMTLRRVPHLTVTWAHQPPPFGFEQRTPYTPFPHHSFAQYPLHVQEQLQLTRPRDVSTTDPFGFLRSRRLPRENSNDSSDTLSEIGNDASVIDSENDVAYPEQTLGNAASSLRWSDMDFPPLGNAKGLLKTGTGVWSEHQPDNRRSRSASLSLSQQNIGSYCSGSRIEAESESKDHGQDLDIPPTPGLGRSPLTPKTPGFPLTPTTDYNALQRLLGDGKDQGYYGDFVNHERVIDPTTLFVGGLETFGPGAWDEEKVTKFFARFGGLEDVKIVRPLNSHAAFAFVKFNNTEAPARAVFEEHNRVYEGRAMRVQLRDCNPPRGSWRHNRGRGTYHQQKFGPHRRAQDSRDELPERTNSQSSRPQDQNTVQKPTQDSTVAEVETSETEPPVYSEVVASKAGEDAADETETAPVSSTEGTASSPSAPFTSLSVSTSENYREWYDEPVSTTPPPQTSFNPPTVSVPTPAPVLPYPVPGGYYTPTPWVPYGQPVQFSMPYVGYPGYAIPGQPPQIPASFQRPPGTDGSVPATPGTWPSMGVYGSYIPYQTPPARTPTVEPAPSQQPLNSRAPLAPTGFIQNEQGTLIAVYQPEALDQYMSGAQVAPPTLPQHPGSTVPGWAPYPQPTVFPTPGVPPAVAVPSRQTVPSANVTWIPNQGFVPQPQSHSTPHVPQTPYLNSSAGAIRVGYPEGGGQAPFRRYQPRRDQGSAQNNQARNSQPRSFQTRNRGNTHLNNSYHGQHGDMQSGPRNHLNNEWNQWGAAGLR